MRSIMILSVMLDMFSGRANPEWQLSDATAREFSLKHDKLERVHVRSIPKPPDLGYRGFIVRGKPDAPEERIYGSYVQIGDAVYLDRNRELETWLIRHAPSSVPENLRSEVLRQIQSR